MHFVLRLYTHSFGNISMTKFNKKNLLVKRGEI